MLGTHLENIPSLRCERFWRMKVVAAVGAGVAALALFGATAFASTTNGTIDATLKYAWSDQMGWLNFGTSGGSVQITDTALTGYAWSDNFGWINLAPAGSGVVNDTNGTLSGSAWGENVGYISFAGVIINSSGKFTGTATGTVAGTVNFDCSNCDVETDWRPANSRSSATSSSSGSSGGGGGAGGPSAQAQTPPQQPLAVIVNNGRLYTSSPLVTLSLIAGSDVTTMAISNLSDFSDAGQEPFVRTHLWDLCSRGGVFSGTCPEGAHTVYVKYFTQWGQSAVVSSTITYARNLTPSQAAATTPRTAQIGAIAPSSIARALQDILSALIPNFLKPKGVPLLPPVVAIPQVPPFAFRAAWNLLPVDAIHEFVFAPLPKEIAFFEAKFPSFKKIFQDVGVVRQSDLQKLVNITFLTPSLGETVGVAKPGDIRFPNVVPFALVSKEAKQKLPQEALFVQALGEKLDMNLNVRLSETGRLEPYINTIVGAPLHLVVKPEGTPSSVRGYLVFDSRMRGNGKRVSQIPKTLGLRMYRTLPEVQLAAVSEIMYENAFGVKEKPPTGNRLALLEFEYTDPDHDGIYTADIMAPVVDGTYEVITRVNYGSGNAVTTKELKLIAVIDPEGYVYEDVGGKQTRIPDAIVTLYMRDPEKKDFVPWPADQFNQRNPQVTDERGTYAFISPEGTYQIAVEAPGYTPYRGEPFNLLKGSSGVHINIELNSKWGILSRIDWKTLLLIIVLLLLIYNFYRDRMRTRALTQKLAGQ